MVSAFSLQALDFLALPVDAVNVRVTTHVPTFKLQVSALTAHLSVAHVSMATHCVFSLTSWNILMCLLLWFLWLFSVIEVPQYYKLMGYQPVSAWEGFNAFIPTTLARPLRTGDPVKTQLVKISQCHHGLSYLLRIVSSCFSCPAGRFPVTHTRGWGRARCQWSKLHIPKRSPSTHSRTPTQNLCKGFFFHCSLMDGSEQCW